MTHSALLWTFLPAETYTRMIARKTLFTWLVTSPTITLLSAQFGAFVMLTLPTAFFVARLTRLATFFGAFAVGTGVAAGFFARWAVFCAGFRTGVATEQGTTAV